jgi:hypothetical protein
MSTSLPTPLANLLTLTPPRPRPSQNPTYSINSATNRERTTW